MTLDEGKFTMPEKKEIMKPYKEGFWVCSNNQYHKEGETCFTDKCKASLTETKTGVPLKYANLEDEGIANYAKRRLKEMEPVLAVIDDSIALEALDDFIVVQEDKFRTGYECKTCDGTGHGDEVCTKCHGNKTEIITNICSNCLGTGKEKDLKRLHGEPEGVIKFKKCNQCTDGKVDLGNIQPGMYPCRNCLVSTDVTGTGARVHSSGFEKCSSCKGQSVALVVPEDSIRRPNSGIVKSIGPKVNNLKCGERVLYSNHTGYEIYFKRNLKFRQMREHEVMSRIHGIGEIHKVLE